MTTRRRGRLEGEYYIESRRLGARNLDPQKYARDRDLLLAEVERNPEDARSVFYLAQSYFDLGDFVNARKWYARRVEMGGWDEEVYYSMCRLAESMAKLGEPWPEVQDVYLRAWEFRPTRAEPLYAIACRYRVDQRYRLGYLFAERAAEIPFPEEDLLYVRADIYAWRAIDEQAVCASWIGKHEEAFTLCRRLLARPDIPDDDRQRIAANRDVAVPTMIEAAVAVPGARWRQPGRRPARCRGHRQPGRRAGSRHHRADTELVSALLHSMCRGSGASWCSMPACPPPDRAALRERYGFLEFSPSHARGRARRPARASSALRSRDGSGCIWARAGGFSPPRISSPA